MSEQNCLFCNIVSGKTDSVIELETDDYVIFKDIRPASRHHYLIVPKQHFESLKVLDNSHSNMGLFTYIHNTLTGLSSDENTFLSNFSVFNAGAG